MKYAIAVVGVMLGLGLGHVAPVIADATPKSEGKIELPKLDGHIADPKSQMSHDDLLRLDHWLEDFRVSTSYSIVVLVTDKLGDEPIEDLAYRAFNTWKVGDRGKDNGVLIVIATGDRKVRIETGKGVGGALTDLQASDIIKNDMAPSLKQGRIAEAIQAGASHIEAALRNGGTPQATQPIDGKNDAGWGVGSWILFIVIVAVFPLFLILLLVSKRFRAWARRSGGGGGGGGFGGPFFFGGGGGGWGSGGGSSGSSGPDTGSGYSGGGGSSGGGGASDSY